MELTAAWDAAHRLRRATSLESVTTEWAAVVNHLEKLWHKACQTCGSKPGFRKWNTEWVETRASDPLLRYITQARNADNHTAQDLASHVMGYLIVKDGKVSFVSTHKNPELAITDIVNRKVTFLIPETHLGKKIESRDPRLLAVHACNFYAEYLRRLRVDFLSMPN